MTTVELAQMSGAMGRPSLFGRIVATVTAWNDARITRRELSSLTEAELDDIGLCRGDIERIARGQFL